MWPFNRKKKPEPIVIPEKKYKYDSIDLTAEAEKVNDKITEFFKNNPAAVPVDIAICPSRMSGVVVAILLYKVEVK